MFETLYVERAVSALPRVQQLIDKFRRARVIECEHYGEIFNRKAQNFRLQKRKPSLILARKQDKRLYAAPPDHAIGGLHNYYFSHLLNCPFDCRYCFLQGKFESANYVLFVNYEDFLADIDDLAQRQTEPVYVFSGYDCDSLALEPLSGFARYFVPAVRELPKIVLELRTKSTQIRQLLQIPPVSNCIVAFSLAPDIVIDSYERGTPSLRERLKAIVDLQQSGWRIGLRFDPLLRFEGHRASYGGFFDDVFGNISAQDVHSVTIGAMRLPKPYAKKMAALYPEEPLLAHLSDSDDVVGYSSAQNSELLAFARDHIARHVDRERIFDQGA